MSKKHDDRKDDFVIRMHVYVMFCEILADAVDRCDTTYLSMFLDSKLCSVAVDVARDYFPEQRKMLLEKLKTARDSVRRW